MVYRKREKRNMGKGSRILLATATLAGIFSGSTIAQTQTTANTNTGLATYDLKRELTLTGTVQSFTAAAKTPPLGAHLILQTSSGRVDVHMGDARFLAANHFTIQTGDSVRIIGETLAYGKGTQFVARIVQKGTQVLEVRSVSGVPLSYMAPRNGTQAKTQGGVL
jgi:hypothetical protein